MEEEIKEKWERTVRFPPKLFMACSLTAFLEKKSMNKIIVDGLILSIIEKLEKHKNDDGWEEIAKNYQTAVEDMRRIQE